MKSSYRLGIDVGSTTIKAVVLNESGDKVFKYYKRHYSEIKDSVVALFEAIRASVGDVTLTVRVAGSSGMLVSDLYEVPFVQEVIASSEALEKRHPDTDVAIELGGEDAKIIYFGHNIEQRMNGVCAGGTGAFIDQMAVLLNTDALGLNELAKGYKTLYPIASRCGVFAKTDVQPLVNEGIAKADIAASVFQAVVNQTVGGLAAGKPIRGRVAFLGGPLTFLEELRKRFIETLNLTEERLIFPDDANLFVAEGTAMLSRGDEPIALKDLMLRRSALDAHVSTSKNSLPALFESEEDYEAFRQRHDKHHLPFIKIEEARGDLFLGIDAGSTTTKVILIDEDGRICYRYYKGNGGQPLNSVQEALLEIYKQLPEGKKIRSSASTGYGEHLVKAALHIDHGEIETIAHYKAAAYFDPAVDFIIDIGGQDMKSLKVKDGAIDSIMLNEACSSGCGSFIETFASTLNLPLESFVERSLFAEAPVDLGTRCTVFMNSKVKQAQKEGASVGEIAAGICYAVIKNALFKVIRLRNVDQLGNRIVVQGGTFLNDGVLRSFEHITGKEVVRPNIAGMMGAFGAALIAMERATEEPSTLSDRPALLQFTHDTSNTRCRLCENHCLLTINRFSDGSKYITGNRCDRGAGKDVQLNEAENMYRYKYEKLFDRPSLPLERATHGTVGLPRVLNIYENYPFWHTLFTKLGYSVVLSPPSSNTLFRRGMESIPSESVCYPAKLAHGHIESLIAQKVDWIFYPSIPFEIKESDAASNHYNCPVVTSYPATIEGNMSTLKEKGVRYSHPFLPLYDEKAMVKALLGEFTPLGHQKSEIKAATGEAYEALRAFKRDIQQKGEALLQKIKSSGERGIVLAGRPYHVDPEINHGIPDMIANYGVHVLTEDAVSHLADVDRPIRIIDQWTYHTRLYNAAALVCREPLLELVQMNSFGCGLDAVTTDQVQEILGANNQLYTVLKIDEINNLGAARIRIRSLLALMEERVEDMMAGEPQAVYVETPVFTEAMKKTHTILAPQMSPIHFDFLQEAFTGEGYNLVVLPSVDTKAIDVGLKYVHNDACYPSIIVVGQIMAAIESGEYDPANTSVIISQTGGGCRATNYIGFIRKALKDAGYEHIPVISLSATGLEKNPGFKLSPRLVKKMCMGILYGDLLMRVLYKVRPYEEVKGMANERYEHWAAICRDTVRGGNYRLYKRTIAGIVRDFDGIPIVNRPKPRVGIVGEILVKYHPTANNDIVTFLEDEGAEVVVPDLMDFFLYTGYNADFRYKHLGGSLRQKIGADLFIAYVEFYRREIKRVLERSVRFEPPKPITHLADGVKNIISLGHQTGEGWFLTAEMVELLEAKVCNIAVLQPFACLPNHITGKGMIQKLKGLFPNANITPIDYDPGASEVNQVNRLKLMLSSAFKHMEEADETT